MSGEDVTWLVFEYDRVDVRTRENPNPAWAPGRLYDVRVVEAPDARSAVRQCGPGFYHPVQLATFRPEGWGTPWLVEEHLTVNTSPFDRGESDE